MFIITKKSRDSNTPYSGISCQVAGIVPAQIYEDKADAERDAALLTEVNSVGFRVMPYAEFPQLL